MALDPRFGLMARRTKAALPIEIVLKGDFAEWTRSLRPETRAYLKAAGYQPRHGRSIALPDEQGGFDRFVVTRDPSRPIFELFGGLASSLPASAFYLLGELPPEEASEAAIGFGAGRYAFDGYLSKQTNERARLVIPSGADARAVERTLDALYLARDLINTPTNDLGPSALAAAARALGLASMIMAAKLPVKLRVLIPAVENSVSASAFRPLDILRSRSGKTVEIGNTDAEGRLVLADALTAAGKPDLIIDFATLTGAARVALGTELPALFSNDDALAGLLLEAAGELDDPLHRLPLHRGYRQSLSSSVADLNNVSDGPYGGAITAALFLQEFVEEGVPWAHLDVMAWNLRPRPGRPRGGEMMGVRAAFTAIERFIARA